ncbi:SDR family NAD(P)-dependent oxidoreductase [Amycolatopsis acidiphila]|uniref:SDR family NAD(P)-dependent oxidoreductase n=1 Tax=Amycolatopsis acidiphila TaxID=715473 RepID=A0A558AAD4_9PSEU|nr:SDR family NAD(P)-dependent oxidoreductase [Amycolatopsis acidiphila]TVT21218.1 SDR family NAD(P)-dependent oxidoreductase [Amycolatopsis acidiphila]UIJ61234.1 SDR family NAD(P)-dependent oxidoreductase [Amycolatopsis acidiphila]GHG78658.1 oxidoreductase [Amycolatopsis acidiphila]
MTDTTGKPLAVVTGASTGIGRELAKQFAEHGFDLVIAAENAELDDAKREIPALGAQVDALRVDLAKPEGVEELVGHVGGRPVTALALNAGVGVGGSFTDGGSLEDQLTIVDLNVRSTVHLAKRVIPRMVEQGGGRVLFTSSIAASTPGPFQSVYHASKSFVGSFAQALREELKDTGVTVTALMPGPTDTEFFTRAGMEDTKLGAGPKDDAAEVGKEGYEALMNGKDHVITGARNKVQAKVSQHSPDTLATKMTRKMSEPGSAS